MTDRKYFEVHVRRSRYALICEGRKLDVLERILRDSLAGKRITIKPMSKEEYAERVFNESVRELARMNEVLGLREERRGRATVEYGEFVKAAPVAPKSADGRQNIRVYRDLESNQRYQLRGSIRITEAGKRPVSCVRIVFEDGTQYIIPASQHKKNKPEGKTENVFIAY